MDQELKDAILYQINKKMPKCNHSCNERGEVEKLKRISKFVYSRPPPYIRRQIEEIQEINDLFKKNWGTIEMPACDECCSPDEKIMRGALINLLVKPELINEKLKEESLKAYRENLEMKKAEQRARMMAEAQERLIEKKKKQDEQNAIQNKLDSILINGWP